MSLENQDESLEVLTSYASAVEAGFAQQILEEAGIQARVGGESTATNLSYVGTAIGGAKLLVRRRDLADAAQVLRDQNTSTEGFQWPDFPDDEDESEADESASQGQQRSSALEPSPELLRAYHAAIIGLFIFPLMVQIYSLYLIVRYRLFLPDRGGNDWRFYVAMIANTVGMFLTRAFWSWEDQLPLEP